MCDNDRSCPTTTELGPSSEFFSFSSPCRSSSSLRSRAGHSRPREFGRGSEEQALDARSWRMPFATAERIYRCLGGGRPARAGDVFQRREEVSRSTIRRWQRSGWVVLRDRTVLTAKGCAALPIHQEVVEFARRSGRSTLFL